MGDWNKVRQACEKLERIRKTAEAHPVQELPAQVERLTSEVAGLKKTIGELYALQEDALHALCEQVSHARRAVEALETGLLDHVLPRLQPRKGRDLSEDGRRALDRLAAIRRNQAS